jgi:hypothetical protein
MPYAIDIEASKRQMFLNVMRPQEVVPREPDGTLREGWSGTMSGGLPVKQIPHAEFPKVVYMHPNEPYQEVEHRNDRFEVVSTDLVPTEHLAKHVNSKAELEAALADGWVTEPYIAKAPPTKKDSLYTPKKKKIA